MLRTHETLGHSDIKRTMIYTHTFYGGPSGGRGTTDGL